MMRLEHSPPSEMLRALTTAVAALRRAGVRARRNHMVMLTEQTGHFTALLVKKTPFTGPRVEATRDVGSATPSCSSPPVRLGTTAGPTPIRPSSNWKAASRLERPRPAVPLRHLAHRRRLALLLQALSLGAPLRRAPRGAEQRPRDRVQRVLLLGSSASGRSALRLPALAPACGEGLRAPQAARYWSASRGSAWDT